MNRTAFFISDGTGITAEALGNSLLSQFESIQFNQVTIPYVDTIEKAQRAVERINKTYEESGERPVIIDTIVDNDVRAQLSRSNGFMLDTFTTFIKPLEKELRTDSSYTVGKSHAITDDQSYKIRIDAVHYALENDDGALTRDYESADVILIGVSRSGKTPTCLYLALQFGVRAANYPITEDDLEELRLPKVLRPHKKKLFGLTIEPERLATIRTERKPNSRYASMRQCEMEVREAEGLYMREGIKYINSTHYSIEEISTRLLQEAELDRRTQ